MRQKVQSILLCVLCVSAVRRLGSVLALDAAVAVWNSLVKKQHVSIIKRPLEGWFALVVRDERATELPADSEPQESMHHPFLLDDFDGDAGGLQSVRVCQALIAQRIKFTHHDQRRRDIRKITGS